MSILTAGGGREFQFTFIGQKVFGGAIVNAVFDATRAQLYWLPVTPEWVLAAIEPL